MTTEIRIYIEGGGQTRHIQAPLRQGFEAFFGAVRRRATERGIRFQVIMCGSRNDVLDDYRHALRSHPHAVNVLLVDSESPVANTDSPGDHLRRRGWNLPHPFDARYHMMVQSMEALFVSDQEALAGFYKKGFHQSALPQHANLEAVSVQQLSAALKAATKQTQKGEYRKIQHAAKILPLLTVACVRKALPHCEKLFLYIESLL